jgi:glycosyltransferase involved in cell wall biosynthesis
MKQKNPKIIVVTPTYNSGMYLERCILSIKNQTYGNFEHIIVDGNSTDETLKIIQKYENTYPMKWISELDEGMYDAINKGFKLAEEGNILAWLNSDDFYFPWTFNVVAKAFERRDIQWLIGVPTNTATVNGRDVICQLPNMPAVFNTRMIEKGVYDGRQMYFISQANCFWTRELWIASGGLNSEYKSAGDYHLWRKFASSAKLYTIQCNLASFQVRENQKSSDRITYYKEVNRRERSRGTSILTLIYLHLYSLLKYKKYMINLSEIL